MWFKISKLIKHCKLKKTVSLIFHLSSSETIIFLSFFSAYKGKFSYLFSFCPFPMSIKPYLMYHSKLLSFGIFFILEHREFLYFYCAFNIVYYLSVVCLKFVSSYYIIPTFIISNFNEVNALILHVFKYCQSPSTIIDTRDTCIYYKIFDCFWGISLCASKHFK